ncbi:hypothetical protein GGR56DRAFT_212021 [Xylariaceae sp. FL0804]|nr:hypothetical protein GGR56DRAFT_212021 [Xylariaceae sp. FL0804]
MKFLAVVALAATTALAQINPGGPLKCEPGTYACKADHSGWLVCNVDETYIVGGVCPKGTACTYIDDLPYCT